MNTKILLPMITKVMPMMLAKTITGIQPMYDAGMHAGTPLYNKKYWPHQLFVENWAKAMDAERWCYDNFKSRYWKSSGRHFAFKRGADAVLFTLKWT